MLAEHQGKQEKRSSAWKASEKVYFVFIKKTNIAQLLRRPCVGICFLVKKKMAELGRSVKHEREMKAAEQAIMQVSNNMTTGYHAGNMKAYEIYQNRFEYFFLQEELDKAKVDDKQ